MRPGLDYRAQPFQFVKLNNKLVLYALKACSEQLAAKHGLSVRLVETPADVQELAASGGCRAFTARVTGKDGRETDDVGVVTIKSASGDALANAMMKGATKAKRRAVLAHCGLGMLDETEIETIPRAQPVKMTITDHDGEPTTIKRWSRPCAPASRKGLRLRARRRRQPEVRRLEPAIRPAPLESADEVSAEEMKASEIIDAAQKASAITRTGTTPRSATRRRTAPASLLNGKRNATRRTRSRSRRNERVGAPGIRPPHLRLRDGLRQRAPLARVVVEARSRGQGAPAQLGRPGSARMGAGNAQGIQQGGGAWMIGPA
jgi:hypothetical protein